MIILYFAVFSIYKNYNWQLAAGLSQKIIRQDLPGLVDLSGENKKLMFVSLPDNLAGAQVLRNGLDLAVKLYYTDSEIEIENLSAYVNLSPKNYDQKILYWGPYVTGGYLAETYDLKNWVTGFDRQETDDYIFELWNYVYQSYSSNSLRLIFKDKDGNFLKAGDEYNRVVIFNEGKLQWLE